MLNSCTFCQEQSLIAKTQIFKDGSKHLRLECKKCKRFIKYLNKETEFLQYLSYLDHEIEDKSQQLKMPLIMENNNKTGNSGQGSQTPMRTFSICLSDIPKEKIKVANNQKAYVSLTMFDNEQVDQYGNDFSIQIAKTKEDREAGVKTVYVGNGKIWGKKETNNSTADLPF